MVETYNLAEPEKMEGFLAKNAFFSGQALPGKEDAHIFADVKEPPCRKNTPFLFAWWWNISGFPTETRETWSKENTNAAKPGDKKAEETIVKEKPAEITTDDLFGDVDDSKPTETVKKAPPAAKAKPAVVLKSRVVFDVKGFEVDQDFHGLGEKIVKEITEDGLVWQKKFEVLPLVFGMKKLRMTMTIEDNKVSSDDILERICSWEDEVQSCDVVEFNKA